MASTVSKDVMVTVEQCKRDSTAGKPFHLTRNVSGISNPEILPKKAPQDPVVQTLDSAIHWIDHYPADKYLGNQLLYPLDGDLFIG